MHARPLVGIEVESRCRAVEARTWKRLRCTDGVRQRIERVLEQPARRRSARCVFRVSCFCARGRGSSGRATALRSHGGGGRGAVHAAGRPWSKRKAVVRGVSTRGSTSTIRAARRVGTERRRRATPTGNRRRRPRRLSRLGLLTRSREQTTPTTIPLTSTALLEPHRKETRGSCACARYRVSLDEANRDIGSVPPHETRHAERS